eukprot:494240-Amphidinium_carterae.1
MAAPEPPPRLEVPEECYELYSDGSGLHPACPVSRRSAWAVVWRDGVAGWGVHSGFFPDWCVAQTVYQAELNGLWQAILLARGRPVRIHVDNAAVCSGFPRSRLLAVRHKLCDKEGQLWAHIAAVAVHPNTQVVKMKAHRSRSDVPANELCHWEGNEEADRAAKAACLRYPELVMEDRRLSDSKRLPSSVAGSFTYQTVCLMAVWMTLAPLSGLMGAPRFNRQRFQQ